MDLPSPVVQDKPLLVASIILARAAAQALGVSLDDSVTEIARHAGFSRTYAYQKLERLLHLAEQLASTNPGRPPAPRGDEDAIDEARDLMIATLRYQLDHPGSVVPGPSGLRTVYAPAFRRFILQQHDAWPDHLTLEAFSTATEVPLETLRDWIRDDRLGLTPPAPLSRKLHVPVNASEVVQQIAERFEQWQGSTREFLREYSTTRGLRLGQIQRVLILLGAIAAPRRRSAPKPPRNRGATQRLSPGAVLATDGKHIHIHLTATDRHLGPVWQPMVDQATSCVAGSTVVDEECAEGVRKSFQDAVDFMGGRSPEVLLHDGKPIYQDQQLAERIAPTQLIQTTPGRPENNAIAEGIFSDFEQQVGSIRLDDSSSEALIRSAAGEVVRAFAAAANHARRAELNGHSREHVLRQHVPSPAQIERDRRFLEKLQADHSRWPRRARQIDESRRLLDHAFAQHECLRGKDPSGSLRRFLAYCQPAVIRRALALFATKVEQEAIEDQRYPHRYLAALVTNCQNEYELQRAEQELLDLAEKQQQWWTADLELELAVLREDHAPGLDLACALAERAALGGLPVEGAFWTDHMLAVVRDQAKLNQPVRTLLIRLYEAPVERRLALIDRLVAEEHGIQ